MLRPWNTKGQQIPHLPFLHGSGWILETIKYFNPDIRRVTLCNVIQKLRILKSSVLSNMIFYWLGWNMVNSDTWHMLCAIYSFQSYCQRFTINTSNKVEVLSGKIWRWIWFFWKAAELMSLNLPVVNCRIVIVGRST